jgi:hypothetical protein
VNGRCTNGNGLCIRRRCKGNINELKKCCKIINYRRQRKRAENKLRKRNEGIILTINELKDKLLNEYCCSIKFCTLV